MGTIIEEVSGSFTWKPRSVAIDGDALGYDKLQSTLASGELRVFYSSSKENTKTKLESYARYKPVLPQRYLGGESDGETKTRAMQVELDPLSAEEIKEGKPDADIQTMFPDYFLPGFFQVWFDQRKKEARELAESICRPSVLLTQRVRDQEVISPRIVGAINDWLVRMGDNKIEETEEGVELASIRSRLEKYQTIAWRFLASTEKAKPGDLAELQASIETALLREASKQPKRDFEFETPRIIGQGAEFVQTFLKTGVRYLGPLRDEPKPVYPLEALENTTGVGYRGEHTAAVLYLHGDTTVRFVGPKELEDNTKEFRETKLRHAVIEWLTYMGIATDVLATDAGVFGNQLQVATEGLEKKHDLTNVGVGVSQVLPIVVSALLAPAKSLLIFEQPELHLHPRVQARLGDFFYSIALAEKQCVLETHSEYMIERLRRRIAEEAGETLLQMLAIYFTERVKGQTKCRKVKVSPYGAIIDWPKDFFEQSQVETAQIIKAASKKRLKDLNQT